MATSHAADSGGARLPTGRVIAVAAAVSAIAILPKFLTGAFAVQLQAELGFGPTALGTATGLFILARAMLSRPLGGLVDHLGSVRGMWLSVSGGLLVAIAFLVLVRSWLALAVILTLAGGMQAITQPAVNRFVTRFVPAARLGFAFGIKQSGPPAAAILAGLAVPVFALTIGWRWAFAASAGLAAIMLLLLPRPNTPRGQRRRATPTAGSAPGVSLGMLTFGVSFVMATINAMQTFIVAGGVAIGMAPGLAGLLLSLGGVTAIAVRVMAGIRADRRGGDHFAFVVRLLAGSSLGFVLLAVGHPIVYLVAMLMVYGTVWGMNGVLFLAVVQTRPAAPGTASGTVIAGGSIGGFLGPVLFGAVVEHLGYRWAWLMTAAWVLTGAILIARSAAALHEREGGATDPDGD